MSTPTPSPSSSCSTSSSFPPPCFTSLSPNSRVLPRVTCTSQRIYLSSCFSTTANNVVSKYSYGWFETQPFLSKPPLSKCFSSSVGVEALVTSKSQDVSAAPAPPRIGDDKIGVLLLNLGGPETLEDVQPFLFNLFADPAEELRKSLWEKNVPAKVYVGMRYWHPFTEEAIEQIKRDGITKLVVLPLYPQFSISTSGSSLRLLESIFR
ncbi:hypothetical protein Pint_27526 [Pistacia integerrima]|uniref:Uncharacterized protein n=1 Tax=Pistacia integerrima TaxID=434235 RepID=A0ACC0YQ22_9ROSI|nr:hypothetical protein Pint_27526 [Pistacia integerrima]